MRRTDAASTVAPVNAGDHVRGDQLGPVIVNYGDFQCPYSRVALREIERVERRTGNAVRFVFRHFPLTELHPHALAAAAAAEAAALQDQFWAMHALLFHRQNALGDDDLRRYAEKLDLDVVRFDRDRTGPAVLERVRRDIRSASATGQVTGTPTLFIDGVVHLGGYGAATLMEAKVGWAGGQAVCTRKCVHTAVECGDTGSVACGLRAAVVVLFRSGPGHRRRRTRCR